LLLPAVTKPASGQPSPSTRLPDLHALLGRLYVEHLLCKRDGGRHVGLESSARRYWLSRRIEADSRLLVVTDMGRSEKEGVMTPEISQALCRLNALPPDQREAAFLEAAPQLGVKPGTVVPRSHWDFDEHYKRMLNQAATGLR
jgi:hypothetical protein